MNFYSRNCYKPNQHSRKLTATQITQSSTDLKNLSTINSTR